jgi:hypothetical protein
MERDGLEIDWLPRLAVSRVAADSTDRSARPHRFSQPDDSGQRFFFNTKWWGGDSYPIFLMIGGEGPESKAAVSDRWYMYDLAREHKALLVCVEHRFYGQSFPTPVRVYVCKHCWAGLVFICLGADPLPYSR